MVMLGVVCTSNSIPNFNLTQSLDFTHDNARSRAFRWGEDGIAGVSDTHGLQNIAFSFWNEEEYVLPTTGSMEIHIWLNRVVPFWKSVFLAYQIPREIMEKASRKPIFILTIPPLVLWPSNKHQITPLTCCTDCMTPTTNRKPRPLLIPIALLYEIFI